MISLKVEEAKGNFFDRVTVTNAEERARVRNLSRLGAYIRQRSRSSIRRRKRASYPGSPPSSHTGWLREIYFGYDARSGSVVVGPVGLNQVNFGADGRPLQGATVPEILEGGGRIGLFEVLKYGRWQRVDLRSRRRIEGMPTRLRVVDIAARPYMRPALNAEISKVPALWANSIRA